MSCSSRTSSGIRYGNPYYWDLVLLEAVRAEPNITLYLNTDVRISMPRPRTSG